MKKIIFLIMLLCSCHINRGGNNVLLDRSPNTLGTLLKLSLLPIGGYLAWRYRDKIPMWLAAIFISLKKMGR